ncbi:4559_t:CDS:2 [Gigaspora rosea]|nr:4559_t:CDS:2 [Gigaspora rosea]
MSIIFLVSAPRTDSSLRVEGTIFNDSTPTNGDPTADDDGISPPNSDNVFSSDTYIKHLQLLQGLAEKINLCKDSGYPLGKVYKYCQLFANYMENSVHL